MGKWLSQLQVLNEILPYVGAASHNVYTKSIHIYLQDMQKLEEKQPEVFHQFTQSHHVMGRSDRYWAGLSLEAETLRAQWILSMPTCAYINKAMQEVTDMEFITTNQHKDMAKARQDRDCKDMFSLLQTVLQNNQFVKSDPSLRNIAQAWLLMPAWMLIHLWKLEKAL